MLWKGYNFTDKFLRLFLNLLTICDCLYWINSCTIPVGRTVIKRGNMDLWLKHKSGNRENWVFIPESITLYLCGPGHLTSPFSNCHICEMGIIYFPNSWTIIKINPSMFVKFLGIPLEEMERKCKLFNYPLISSQTQVANAWIKILIHSLCTQRSCNQSKSACCPNSSQLISFYLARFVPHNSCLTDGAKFSTHLQFHWSQ